MDKGDSSDELYARLQGDVTQNYLQKDEPSYVNKGEYNFGSIV
jgi:hypothetical protein